MYEVTIVGGGIAGCTAAIYAARKRMNFLVMRKEFGGQFLESGEIINYPGIVKTNGVEFRSIFEKQLAFNQIKPKTGEEVKKIERAKEGLRVISDKASYETKTVIIATGSIPRKLNVPGEAEYANKGLTYCSVCDGPLFSGMDIAVIGGGNSALEGVDFTKDIAKKIYLVNINKEFNAHEYLIENITSYKNVEVISEAKTIEIIGDKFVNGLVYEKNNEKKRLDIGGVIIEIGRQPMTNFLEGFLALDEHRHIAADCQ